MKTRAAVAWGVDQPWSIEEVTLDGPKAGEVIVKTAFAGLCHSDEHVLTGDIVPTDGQLQRAGLETYWPMIGGHEGAGVVVEIGPGVTSVEIGDHVAANFIPACGRCHWCGTGRQNLCDLGAHTLAGPMVSDGRFRHHIGDTPVNRMSQLGTFAEHLLLHEASVVKVEKDVPLELVTLLSCGVATGVGSAQNRADIAPGGTVIVVGIGGIGANAVQGARLAGAAHIIAVDTNPDKEKAARTFGATDFFVNLGDAITRANEVTWGRLADACILCPGVVDGDLIGTALKAVSKDGTVVVTGLAPMHARDVRLDLFNLTMFNKQIRGTIYGSSSPRSEIPRLMHEYRSGRLLLEELITRRYTLDQINDGYQDMRDGKNVRGIIAF